MKTMNNKFSKIILFASLFVSVIGCKKSTPDVVPPDAQTIIVGKVWKIESRVENGGTASLPNCAKDDILELKVNGTFNSLIGTTPCNPNETDVVGGTYTFSADKKLITFTVPGFSYTGKIIEAIANKFTIEFDLGPGFIIKDTFVPKI
jgi:Lipocalin-like domain